MGDLKHKKLVVDGGSLVEQKSINNQENWSTEFYQYKSPDEVSQSDWVGEFNRKHSDLSDGDWVNQFTKQHSNHTADDWPAVFDNLKIDDTNTFEDVWKNPNFDENIVNSFNSIKDPRASDYEFIPNNIYLEYPISALKELNFESVTNSILVSEAILQKNPTDFIEWYELGKRQQENENEYSAIIALRKCIELDPQNLDARLLLSVSYTNENYVHEAYQLFEEWIAINPMYKSNPEQSVNAALMHRHDNIVDLYLQAAMSRPGSDFDPQVQIALGILYNIGMEYEKAQDCFRAALSGLPNDFQVNYILISYGTNLGPL